MSMEFAEDTVLNVFAKAAVVNVETGAFRFVMLKPGYRDDMHIDSPDIYTYIRRQVEDKTVYPEHADEYLRYSDRDYVKKRIEMGVGRSVISYRRKVGDAFKWMTFSIVCPEDFSDEKPYALFTWRESDNDTTTMFDAVSVLSSFYHKILRINLTDDTYEIVKLDPHEEKALSDLGLKKPEHISAWLKQFAEKGFVHPDDVNAYLDFTDVERLKRVFKEDRATRSIRYRRKAADDYRWAQMYLMPSVEYSDENQVLTLYVRDVHDDHIATLRDKEKMTQLLERDALTVLYNRHKYQEDLELVDKSSYTRMTVAYIDVNGLHEVNNKLGHDAGDDMLCAVADALKKYFPDERCYRIGGDEFVMISVRLSEGTVTRTFEEVRKDLRRDDYEVAIGIASDRPEKKENIVGIAELRMREDKAEYYRRHGDRRKRSQMNEQLEKILTEKKDEEFFLKIISKNFAGVYFVDLSDTETKNVRHIFVPKYFIDLLVKFDYDYKKALMAYARQYVMAEYLHFFEESIDFDRLIKVLEEKGSSSFEYRKADGSLIHLHIIKQEDESGEWDGKSSLWIFEEGALDTAPSISESKYLR